MKVDGRSNTGRVWVDDRELRPERSQRLYNHSPDGFAWGYGGSGPAQLALALLLNAGVPEDIALDKYQDFKREVIATLAIDDDFLINLDISPDGQWVLK